MQKCVESSVIPNGTAPEKVEQITKDFLAVYDVHDIRHCLSEVLVVYFMFYIHTDQLLNKEYADRLHANYIVLDKFLSDLQTAQQSCKS